jgi:hypothetical protein
MAKILTTVAPAPQLCRRVAFGLDSSQESQSQPLWLRCKQRG